MNVSAVKGDRRDFPQTGYKSDRAVPGPQVPGPQVPVGLSASDLGSKGSPGSGSSGKEAEVDDLTRLLMQSMESSGDPDFFGKNLF